MSMNMKKNYLETMFLGVTVKQLGAIKSVKQVIQQKYATTTSGSLL